MREFFPLEGIHLEMLQDDFRKKKITLGEDELIRLLDDPKTNKHWKWSAAIALRKYGTNRCIPFLKKAIDFPNEDVINVSLLTISHIGGKNELDYLISLLNKKGLKKDYVLWAISAISEKDALVPVVEFMRQKLKVHKRPSTKKISGIDQGLVYLDKFSSELIAIEILQGYSENWAKISPHIQSIIKRKTEYFKNK